MITHRYRILRSMLLLFGMCCTLPSFSQDPGSGVETILRDTIIKVDARPDLGFNYPYFIRIPKGAALYGQQYLLVETNNTGLNDSLPYHEKGTYGEVIQNSLGSSLCAELKLPFLMPVFPRSQTAWKIYTHALDRDAVLIEEGEMARLDLQLIAMIRDAATQLEAFHIAVHEKVLMNGFSASGTFANRFALIHPEMVAGVACGGINAIPVLPTEKAGQAKLIYPLGTYDFQQIFHDTFNIREYRKVPQFIYMGAKDGNDAVSFDDAYSTKERKIVYKTLGKVMIPTRFERCESEYKTANTAAQFKVYPNIGHETDREVFMDVAFFFSGIIERD